ncbi:flippase [Almyronema epifaneia]|uniref:Flippase n=1 Tax=Almyronema epifaneia S1 TaxID=2991925 RepID=A0ABW6IJ91_9CYAN
MFIQRITNLFSSISLYLEKSSERKKILKNLTWLLSERGLKVIAELGVGTWMARYLGPQNFGVYNYSLAIISLFSAFTNLGLSGIVVRDLVRNQQRELEILGSTLFLKIVAGLIGTLAILIFASVANFQTVVVKLALSILSLSLTFQAFDTIDLYFQSKIRSKYTVIIKVIIIAVSSIVKIALIALNASVLAFAAIASGEFAFTALGLALIYQANEKQLFQWKFNLKTAKSLLSQSWPLIISQMGVVIYFKVDQIMIQNFLNLESVGIYSAAVRLSESCYFLPGLVMASLFPSILQSKHISESAYIQNFQKSYNLMAAIAYAIIILGIFSSNILVSLLYGEDYQEAGLILSIHLTSSLFIFLGAVLSKWLISEELIFFSLTRHGAGACMNLLLNLFFIPAYGILGAAIATVLSYGVATYGACFLDSRTRIAGTMMTQAIFMPLYWLKKNQ